MATETLAMLMRVNLSMGAAILLVLALRLMMRRWFGAREVVVTKLTGRCCRRSLGLDVDSHASSQRCFNALLHRFKDTVSYA